MSFRLNWEQLLSEKRQPLPENVSRPATNAQSASQARRTPFEKDFDRVIFSAPFRRLARKTQVHPLARVDHIHNRLTHSLEVASVGRSLAYAAGRLIVSRGEMPGGRTIEDLNCIVQAACLAHDIGNPPFGHAGEYAIREWMNAEGHLLFGTDIAQCLNGVTRDWLHFEGNAQSFRLVSRADNREQSYFRFTYASLGALVKYPWDSSDQRVEKFHKLNVFSTEAEIYKDVVSELGLKRPDYTAARHPLSYLSEAADDICYRICDFEDAVELKILPEGEVREIFLKIINRTEDLPLPGLRAAAISTLVENAIVAFENNYDQIMSAERPDNKDLKSDFPAHMQEGLQLMKERYQLIFGDRTKVATELGAYNTLGRILAVYARCVKKLTSHANYEKLSFIDKRCLELAWGEKYVQANQDKALSWWLSRAMDFVTGMTDNYAIQVSKEIAG